MKNVYARDPDGTWKAIKYDDYMNPEPGQEGRVYNESSGKFVLKIFNYANETYLAQKHSKIQGMLASEMLSYFERRQQQDFAWPAFTVHAVKSSDSFIGFGMRKLSGYEALSGLFSKVAAISKSFNDLDRASVCAYLAHLFSLAHDREVIIGDVKDSNIRINSKTQHLSIIDCDSFQISVNGQLFTSDVGTEEYASPRLIRAIERRGTRPDFLGIAREKSDDTFALAIICFCVLTTGHHPFRIHQTKLVDNIRNRRFPYAGGSTTPPNVSALKAYHNLPKDLKTLFEATFEDGQDFPAVRWRSEFYKYSQALRKFQPGPWRPPTAVTLPTTATDQKHISVLARGAVTPPAGDSASGATVKSWMAPLKIFLGSILKRIFRT